MVKIVRENAFDRKKKKFGLKLNSGLVVIGLRTTGPRTVISQLSIFNWVFVIAHAYFHITLLLSCFFAEYERLSAC